jgi:hypothetical protein
VAEKGSCYAIEGANERCEDILEHLIRGIASVENSFSVAIFIVSKAGYDILRYSADGKSDEARTTLAYMMASHDGTVALIPLARSAGPLKFRSM